MYGGKGKGVSETPRYISKKAPIVLAVINRKGGCGKTSSSVTIAGLLNKECGYKNVCIVDLDGQCSATLWMAQSLSGSLETPVRGTIKDYIESNGSISASDISRKFTFNRAAGDVYYASLESKAQTALTPADAKPATRTCTVTLIPGDDDIDNIVVNSPDILRRLVDELAADDPENTVVIFDCPPQYMPAVSLVMMTGCYIVSPVTASNDAIAGIPSILQTVNAAREAGYDAKFLGLYIWALDQRESLPKELVSALRENLGEDLLFNTVVRRTSSIERARSLGVPPCIYEFMTPFFAETYALTCEILDRIKKLEEEM